MQDKNIINLIGFQGIKVKNIESFNNIKYIYFEMDKIIPRCPKCKCSKSHIHDYRD